MQDLLTTREAAAVLRLAPKTLSNWRWLDVGPRWVRVGGRVRYSRHEVTRWLTLRSVRPACG